LVFCRYAVPFRKTADDERMEGTHSEQRNKEKGGSATLEGYLPPSDTSDMKLTKIEKQW